LRYLFVACLLGFQALASAESPAGAFDVTALPASHGIADAADVTDGSLDDKFGPYDYVESRMSAPAFWLRLRATEGIEAANTMPALRVSQGRHQTLQVYLPDADGSEPLPVAAILSGFRGELSVLYPLPDGLAPDTPLYVRIAAEGRGAETLRFTVAPLNEALAQGAGHARMISLAFGALMSMALAALVIWFVLQERLLLLYATLFSLQALYIAFLSGQGFDWPGFTFARAFHAHAWNVPAAFSGAAACLFVREIADLRRYSPPIYRVFGWLAIVFVALAFANFAHLIGAGGLVAPIGNLIFVGVAIFTLVVAFLAWRRGSRAAGWFLLAWGLLEIFTIATAVSFLVGNAEPLVHYGLPLSMVAAAILVALGVADRLREQRLALSDAERRAQTDPLTGVLNRRSLIERLDAACRRAQARGLPIALLFIDLDHFKVINDTRGHLAGDACLKAVITPIQSELRQSDVIGRYGGEEFVVILSSADAAAAHAIAQRIRLRVAELEVNGFGPPISLTCSIGVATSDTLGVWGEHLVARADAAVYVAKNAGRNQVQVAPPAAA
jgi:diguanylate cyclase (GGDEF)-like protein